MDTDDVSDIDHYAQFLDAPKASLKASITIQDNSLLTRELELTPIYIRGLRIGTHHRVITTVEDGNRDAIVLQLYQQPDENARSASSIIAGDTFLIKEPFFKGYGRCYATTLSNHPSPSEETFIRLNRALAYLRGESFDAALADIQCLDPASSSSENALYRTGKTLYGLERFSQCCYILQTLCTYDLKATYKEVSRITPPHLDHATFVGPVVMKESPGRGRGLFTTKSVEANELLLCEKTFAHCYADSSNEGCNSCSKISPLVNIHTNRMTMGTQSNLIMADVQKLWRNPSLLSEFLTLLRGSYEPVRVTEVDGKPVIDTKRNRHHSCSIWPMASRINYSCISNVYHSFIDDLQIMRASCDIPTDTELTFWYKIPTGDHYEMKKGPKQQGFKCECTICLDSKNAPKKLWKRRDLLGDLKATLNGTNVNTAEAERTLTTINQTCRRSPADVPRLVLRESLMPVYSLGTLGFVIKGTQLLHHPHPNVKSWHILLVWAKMRPSKRRVTHRAI
ncbi:hypothetical protein B0O99DRAFT_658114 [Bisporella sp. PMI_857]|nr:hypothetical protein B0O99DRAFT_658114 [Bisporella sp. PMI_857]